MTTSPKVLAALLRVAVDDGVPAGSSLLELPGTTTGLTALQRLVDESCDQLDAPRGTAAKALLQLQPALPTRKEVAARRDEFDRLLGASRHSRLEERAICEEVAAHLATRVRPPTVGKLRQIGKTAWALMGVNLLAVVGTVLSVVSLWPEPPRQLDGEVNVAVVHEAVDDQEGQDQLRTLASTVVSRLEERDGAEGRQFSLAVLSPSESEPLDLGAEPAGVLLPEVARRHSADVVVLVRRGTADFTAVTDVYVDARAVEGAEELAGAYEFGAPVLLGGGSRAAAGGTVREAVTARATTLIDFIDGLGGMQRREFAYAESAFSRTVREVDPAESQVVAIANLFLGNTMVEIAARAADDGSDALRRAQSAYEAGLREDPASPRLRLGLLQSRYLRAHGGCTPQAVDAGELDDVAAELRRLRQDLIGPPLVLARTDLTLGRTQLCLLIAGLSGDTEAVTASLTDVLERTGQGDRILQEVAAEAHMDLGLLLTQGTPTPSRLAAARDHYDRARDLAVDPFRRGVATFRVGLLAAQSGRSDEAHLLLTEAAELADEAAHPVLADEARRVLEQLEG